MIWKTFGGSLAAAAVGLVASLIYGGPSGLALTAILAILEISLSFDNAVVNAAVLVRLSQFWRRLFLTVGIAVAVFGMRLVFPLVIVGVSARLSPARAVRLALAKGDPHTPGSYGYLLHAAHPAIAAFGGMFLLLLFLEFVLTDREIAWLVWLERPLARAGGVDKLGVLISLAVLLLAADTLASAHRQSTVLGAGVLGIVCYLALTGLTSLLDVEGEKPHGTGGVGAVAPLVGRAALVVFVYLEVLDASFSFDGVVGAFALTSDPIIIAIGLGVGAVFIRSLTVLLVRTEALSSYVYLEHGAMWAIGALAVVLLLTIRYEVPELLTGLIGVVFIAAALLSSVRRRHRTEVTPR